MIELNSTIIGACIGLCGSLIVVIFTFWFNYLLQKKQRKEERKDRVVTLLYLLVATSENAIYIKDYRAQYLSLMLEHLYEIRGVVEADFKHINTEMLEFFEYTLDLIESIKYFHADLNREEMVANYKKSVIYLLKK